MVLSLIQSDTIIQLKSTLWKEHLEGLSERVADIKTRAHTMKCLSTMSEAVGPGFIFERSFGLNFLGFNSSPILQDYNKNIVMATRIPIGNVAAAMRQAIEKSSKGILAYVLKCLGDNKKHMKECALNDLDAWIVVAHLDKMVPYIAIALVDSKLSVEGHKDLFDWLSRKLYGLSSFVEATQLLKFAFSAMTVRSDYSTFWSFVVYEIYRIICNASYS
ncbi:hypothetical protein Fmac_015086 [Flemingia macrophylla]|uniref:Uncharacterized protein n=1 Tax=Flemingia macrophylla TaxID=520843 RepID=A0ABD1MEC5_9FABA